MKTETKTSDIRATLAAREAKQAADKAKIGLAEWVEKEASGTGCGETPFAAAVEAQRKANAAASALAKIPAPRRGLAAQHVKIGEEVGLAAAKLGQVYSGETSYTVRWMTMETAVSGLASATTQTGIGSQYSRSCTYKKTDAMHLVVLDPAGIPALVEAQALRAASENEGLPLIALYPDHSAVWVRLRGKTILSERGWVAFGGGHCFHSTKSREDAEARLSRKLDTIRREDAKARENRRAHRRSGLIARLCKGAVATIEDARALGYCSPGIAAFQNRHGIGDRATLPELVKTGDPSAVRLAFAVARKVSRNPEPVTP